MTTDEFQKLCARTECDYRDALLRMAGQALYLAPAEPGQDGSVPSVVNELLFIRLAHAAMGLAGEAGELVSDVVRSIYHGKLLDRRHLAEELGDCLWFIALACNTLGIRLEEIMIRNIAKLKTRYPTAYSDEATANRDVAAEQAAMGASGAIQ